MLVQIIRHGIESAGVAKCRIRVVGRNPKVIAASGLWKRLEHQRSIRRGVRNVALKGGKVAADVVADFVLIEARLAYSQLIPPCARHG